MVMTEKKICSICDREFTENADNASPFKGECCTECSFTKVIIIRAALVQGYAILFDVYKNSIDCITNPEKLTLKSSQETVGGHIEIVDLSNGYIAVVNKEAKLKNLPINRQWLKTEMSDLCSPLYGNVILVKKGVLK